MASRTNHSWVKRSLGSVRSYGQSAMDWLLENPWLPALLVTGLVASMTITDLYGDIVEHGWEYLSVLEGSIYLGFPILFGTSIYFLFKFYDLHRKDIQTNLYNSDYFSRVLRSQLNRNEPEELFLLFVDVDNFKDINDELGHVRGDRILQDIARIIESSIRWGFDRAFRYGGDEFTVILSQINSTQAKAVANRIGDRIAEEFDEPITVSIGLVGAWDGVEPQTLVKKADQVMYQAKQEGKSQVRQELARSH